MTPARSSTIFTFLTLLGLTAGCQSLANLFRPIAHPPTEIGPWQRTSVAADFKTTIQPKPETATQATYEHKQTGVLVTLTQHKMPTKDDALGLLLGTTYNKDNHSIELKNSGWSTIYQQNQRVTFWQSNLLTTASAKVALTQMQWQELLAPIAQAGPKASPRPRPFTLLLREESSLKSARYSYDGKVGKAKLADFFYADWRSKGFQGHFVFKEFAAGRAAENYQLNLTKQPGAVFSKHLWPKFNRSYPLLSWQQNEARVYLIRLENTLLGFSGNLTEPQAAAEINSILEAYVL